MTYSHPMWMFALMLPRTITGEPYYGTIVLQLILSGLAVMIMVRAQTHLAVTALAMLGMACSRSFSDFSTSGLENPLSHLLIAWLLFRSAQANVETTKPRGIACITAMIMLTRHDLAPLVIPVLASALQGHNRAEWAKTMALAVTPVLLWLLFATIYYGAPWPTTAYSKLFAVHAGESAMLARGLAYAADLATYDTACFCVILLALIVGGVWRVRGTLSVTLGCVLQVAYVVRVGGDFMSGRFFTPVFVASLWILTQWLSKLAPSWRRRTAIYVAMVLVAGAFFRGVPAQFTPWRSPALRTVNGIADERAGYQAHLGLWSGSRPPLQPGVFAPLLGAVRGHAVAYTETAGWIGLLGGPTLHIIDPYICDPLLTRLPAILDAGFRPGHYRRRIPEGLLESLAHGDNRIDDPRLRKYYDSIRLLSRGPILSVARLQTAAGLMLGRVPPEFADYLTSDYLRPPMRQRALRDFPVEPRMDLPWFASDAILIYDGGLRINCAPSAGANRLELALQSDDEYEIAVYDGSVLRMQRISPPPHPVTDLATAFLATFSWRTIDTTGQTFDHIIIRTRASIDHVGAVLAVNVAR
ncbi:MAG: hypothetical protein U1E73_09590 [Planctomycetota bacterium]